MTQRLEKWLRGLCNSLQISEVPTPGEDGTYGLDINPETRLEVKDTGERIFLRAKICNAPHIDKEGLFMHLMAANLLGQGTGGAVIGLTEEKEDLTLSLCLTYDLNDIIFKERIEDFVNYLDFWRGEIERFRRRAEDSIL